LASTVHTIERSDSVQNISTSQQPVKRGSSSALRASAKSKAHKLSTQPAHNWKVIPEQQQYNTLTALRLRCHSPAVLKANKYTQRPHEINFIGKDAIAVPMQAPTYHWQTSKRTAIALDCEMVGTGDNNESELARISAIDYLTGEILIDTLVEPTRFVTDWRTQYSGITEEAMTASVSQGDTLKGWPKARAELFKYMDTDTVLVGQALHFDLIALGIQHQRVVDSAILASDAVGHKVRKRWGLKDLCDQLLHIKIQTDSKVGHDSVEDAFAAREVVLWCIGHPSALANWGTKQRKQYYSKKSSKAKAGTTSQWFCSSSSKVGRYEDYEDEDVLTWSDVAGDCGDRNYDPWSSD
jgi:DNA polymerase III epsilon subunit-like protein